VAVSKEVGKLEEWIYVLAAKAEGKGRQWEALGSLDRKKRILPPMPGPDESWVSSGSSLVGSFFVMAGGYAAHYGWWEGLSVWCMSEQVLNFMSFFRTCLGMCFIKRKESSNNKRRAPRTDARKQQTEKQEAKEKEDKKTAQAWSESSRRYWRKSDNIKKPAEIQRPPS
jgi:hypothetical protein